MARKSDDYRGMSFRTPVRHYELLAEVARVRGVDVTALLNALVADAVPGLRAWLDAYHASQSNRAESAFIEERVPEAWRSRVRAVLAEVDAPGADRRKILARRTEPPGVISTVKFILEQREKWEAIRGEAEGESKATR